MPRVSNSEIITTMASLEAMGEINNIPPVQLDAILAKALAELETGKKLPPTP